MADQNILVVLNSIQAQLKGKDYYVFYENPIECSER